MNGKRMILVLQRGWVMVGEVHQHATNSIFLTVTHGGNVRRWGTTKGLGELASKGPLGDTVIDPHETETTIPLFSIIQLFECSERWNKWFSK